MAEDVGKRVRNDALQLRDGPDALHGERLAGARLAVGEDGAVVALQDVLDDRPRHLVVDVKLPTERTRSEVPEAVVRPGIEGCTDTFYAKYRHVPQ